MESYHSTVSTDYILFMHSSVDVYLGCFHLPAIVNNAALNIGLQGSVEILLSILWDMYLRAELLDQMVILCLNFGGPITLTSNWRSEPQKRDLC